MTKIGEYKGDGTWPFVATSEGDDIIVRDTHATWFGGTDDKSDNGMTASGISTRPPGIMGCALPMDIGNFAPTDGSPLRKMPWGTIVQVWAPNTNRIVRIQLIDLGPAKWACIENKAAIDLTQAAFQALGYSKAVGVIKVDYRIIGARKRFP